MTFLPSARTSKILDKKRLTTAAQEERIRAILSERGLYGLDISGVWLERVFEAYRQPHRHFHTTQHILDICELIRERSWDDPAMASELLLTALFHDVIWYPLDGNCERRSVDALEYVMAQCNNPVPTQPLNNVRKLILATKKQEDINETARRFMEYDCHDILSGNPVDLLAYEFQIFQEYQCLNMVDYRKGRATFFTRFAKRFPQCRATMDFLMEYQKRRRPRIGIYAGTFNPFHIGHLAILEKAEMMFDKVIVAVGINPQKGYIGKDETLSRILPFHEVIYFDTLMVDLLDQESKLSDVTLIRGLRNGYDLDYEMNQLRYMQEMRPDTNCVYIPCNKELEHISSSALKGFAMFDLHGRDSMYYPKKYSYYHRSIEELFHL